MIFDASAGNHEKIVVKDSGDQSIPFVTYYDTETKEIELMVKLQDSKKEEDGSYIPYLLLGEDKKPISVRFILPGSYAVGDDGKAI